MNKYTQALVSILDNAQYPIEITTGAMFEIKQTIFEETGRVINYKNAIYYYETEAGYDRQRKLKNTYLVSIEK